MQKEYYTVRKENERVWIVDHTCCDMEGEPLEYEQKYEYEAKEICETLNSLTSSAETLSNIMEIIHHIKYGKGEWQDLDDYIYKGISMDKIRCRYDDIWEMIIRAKEKKEMKE